MLLLVKNTINQNVCVKAVMFIDEGNRNRIVTRGKRFVW